MNSPTTTREQNYLTAGERGARSQRSVLLERDLRLRNQKYAGAIAEVKSRISALEAERARLAEQLINSNDQWTRTQFNDANMELENARNLAAACEERIAANSAAIQELSPNPAQLERRREQQQRLSDVSSERLESDREACRLIGQLRRILLARGEMTDRMRELAGALDLTVASGELDEFRFERLSETLAESLAETLANALPSDHSSECELWHGWFTGQRPAATAYVVRDEHLTVRETLADHGVYALGDPIVLSEDEARELLREDRPALEDGAAWRVVPPSIMTVSAYEEAAQTARDEGLTLREVLLRQNIDRELRAREAFLAAEEAAGARSRE